MGKGEMIDERYNITMSKSFCRSVYQMYEKHQNDKTTEFHDIQLYLCH